jgi:iron-sulfur cluster protein
MNAMDYGQLEITTAKVCPVNCKPHCPQEKFREAYGGRAQELLSYDDFCQAIETVPSTVWIGFSGFAEPFLNQRAVDMMQYARDRGHRLTLYTTLVGLKPEDVGRVKSIAPEELVLHLPDDRGIAHISGIQAYKDALFEALSTWDGQVMRMDREFVSNERAGNCDTAAPLKVRGPFRCVKLVRPNFVMLPNCDLVLCCMDWTLRHRVGNLLTQSYAEIAAGEPFRRIARSRWKVGGTELCRSCKWAEPLVSIRGAKTLAKRLVGA